VGVGNTLSAFLGGRQKADFEIKSLQEWMRK